VTRGWDSPAAADIAPSGSARGVVPRPTRVRFLLDADHIHVGEPGSDQRLAGVRMRGVVVHRLSDAQNGLRNPSVDFGIWLTSRVPRG